MQDGSCGQTTSRVSAVVFVGSLALGAGSLDAFALSNAYKDIFAYKLGGFADQSAFIGFNNSKIDRNKGIYPTQSFATIVGYLGLDLNFLPKSPSHKIKVKFGGAVGGVLYDGTKNSSEGSVVSDFFGYYDGFMGGYVNVLDDDSIPVKNAKYRNAVRNYIFSDAYIEYDYKNHFGFKGGRYKSKMEYRSGWTQGFEVYGGGRDFRLTWFSSWGRAFAYGSYIQDWYAARPTFSGNYTKNSSGGYDKHGYPILLGTHALQLNYSRHKFQLEGFFYFSPKIFNAPGFKVGWDSNPNFSGRGFRSQTTLLAFFPIYYPWMIVKSDGSPVYAFDTPATRTGQSLVIKQRFDFNEFFIVGTFLKNFQNPNFKIGNMGNPAGVLTGDNSIYAGNWSTSIKADAVTGNFGYGGKHFKDTFNWEMQWQWSSSPVSHDGRVTLLLGYTFNKILSATVTLAYFGIHTNKGYQAGLNAPCKTGCQGGYQDRSSLTTSLVATF
ncbi:outer membrane family protein [Helicobacter felis]|uniref:OMP1128 n=1 Tax=Helicobacter felis TaxID=214 RepID=A0A1M4NG33_HELFE|nr:outer membrane family protein [Helicobacter felis]SFZ70982.1 OMP1128 [Helicobacter felis ATCC 49179]